MKNFYNIVFLIENIGSSKKIVSVISSLHNGTIVITKFLNLLSNIAIATVSEGTFAILSSTKQHVCFMVHDASTVFTIVSLLSTQQGGGQISE